MAGVENQQMCQLEAFLLRNCCFIQVKLSQHPSYLHSLPAKIVKTSGIEDFVMPKSNRSGKSAVITKEQLQLVSKGLPEKYSLLAEMLYFSAGRLREITTLKVRNINFKEGLLVIEKSSTKTKETKSIPIHPTTLKKVMNWIEEHSLEANDYIFFTSSKNTNYKVGEKALASQSVDEYFRKAFDWNGISGASTHSFRKSRLCHLMEAGWHLADIQNISNHKTLTALQQYLETDKQVTFDKYRRLFEEEVL